MIEILAIILPVFLVVLVGYLANWWGLISDQDADGIMNFSQKVGVPILMFRAISQVDLSVSFNFPVLASFYAGALAGFACGVFGARAVGRAWEDCIAIGFCCLFSTAVLIGLPVTERAFGPDVLVTNYAIIALHSPICYFVGITAMELVRARGKPLAGLPKQVLKSMFANQIILGVVLGLGFNVLHIQLPAPLGDGADMIARAALPAALFALGAMIRRYKPEGDMRMIGMICVISLVVHPLVSYLCANGLNLSQDNLRSIVISGAGAPGINGYIFANIYGVAKRVTASAVLVAIFTSAITLTLWLHVLA